MNYEQKYKAALGWMQGLYNGLHGKTKEEAETYFPELTESDDERIRKELIAFIKKRDRSGCDYDYDQWIAWLEKQSKNKPFDYTNVDIQQKDFAPKSAMEAIKEEKIDNVNKVEPKFKVGFKVGDWIVNNISKDIFLIKSYSSGYCTLEDTKGIFYHPCLPPNDEFHLWTVDDAKKGDILQANKCTLIFDSLAKDIDGNTVISSWYYCDTETFYGMGTCKPDLWVTEGVVPATKEQCNILFQKMKEKGYEWDVKEKKLIKL